MQLAGVVGQKNLADILYQIKNYENLLQKLQEARLADANPGREQRNILETELRKFGAEMLSLGLSILQQERQSVYRLLVLAKQVPIYFLIILFVVMAFWPQIVPADTGTLVASDEIHPAHRPKGNSLPSSSPGSTRMNFMISLKP